MASATSAFPFSSLGLGHDTEVYRLMPIFGAGPTHLVDLLGSFTVVTILVSILVRLVGTLGRGLNWLKVARAGAINRADDGLGSVEPSQAGSQLGSTRFYLWSTIAIPCLIFVLTTNVYFYHYYFVLCPFLFVLVAACLLP